MADRVTAMEVFARVAALGSLSAAARALRISQTMATKHVASLEERLGTKLLHRTTRRMTLTEAGQNYLDAVEEILESISEADAQASQSATEVQGRLRLNVPVSFGIREVAPLVPKLVTQYPKLEVDLGLNDRQVNLIEEGWDLAIRIGELRDSSMIARRLAPCSMVVCASPAYLEQFGKPNEISDLKQHNCLGYTLSDRVGTRRWHFAPDGTKSVAISGTIQANNGDVLVRAAVEGQGIVYQPTFLVGEELDTGALIELELDHGTMDLDGIFAVYPADRRPPAKLRATIDFFVDAFAPDPPWERR
ncbi:MAG: LysR substrate-binding domain-containing protein [Pseudomonadota bacterium]